MPQEFNDIASRLDHLLAAVLPGTFSKLNISENFDLSVKLPLDQDESTSITVNNVSTSIPLSYEVSHGNVDQVFVDYGITSICSLYKNSLNTFAQQLVNMTDTLKKENSNEDEILFVAECSQTPRLAVFIGFKNDSNEFSYIKVYTAGSYFTIKAEGDPIVTFNGEEHNIKEATFEHPQFQSDFK